MTLRQYLSTLSYDLFLAALVVFMATAFLDVLFPGLVTRVFNIKILIILGAIGFGGMMVFPPKESTPRASYYIGVVLVAVWLTLTSYYMIPRTDAWRLLISLGVGATVLLAGLAVPDPNPKKLKS